MHLVLLEIHSLLPWTVVNNQHIEKRFHFRGLLILLTGDFFFSALPQVRSLPQNQLSAHRSHKINIFVSDPSLAAWPD